MRKDELLHVHQLLAAVKRDLERRGDLDEDALATYEDLSVSPLAAYAQKGDHAAAVRTLAAALARSGQSPVDHGSEDEQPPLAH